MKGEKFTILKNDGSSIEMEFTFVKWKNGSQVSAMYDQKNRKRGWAKKVGSKFEVALTMGLGSPRKTFTHRSRKQALIMAVDHWNASRQGKVCTVCQEQFENKLPLYLGSRACDKHANGDFIMTL